MLVLHRKEGEGVVIGGDITLTIVRIDDGQVRIGISAPRDVIILREELIDKQLEACSFPDSVASEPQHQPARVRSLPKFLKGMAIRF